MRALARPKPDLNYNVSVEINRLREHRDEEHEDPAANRHIPKTGQTGHILIATWNIANLGVHKRRIKDIRLIAEILSWFEIVAIQEVADNLSDLDRIMKELPDHYRYVFNDRAGNDERSAYIYDTRRVQLGPKIGEVVVVDSDRKWVKLPGINRKYPGFNRNPYLVSFIIEGKRILLANCHLLYGPSDTTAEKKESLELRQLEAYAIARWCDLRRDDKHVWTKNIIALGDFNLPKAETSDVVFEALTRRGLQLPPHETRIPTNLSNTADYDQIAVTPGLMSRVDEMGVFDFDGAIFKSQYKPGNIGYWRKCAKYYISDHRPLWMQLSV